MGLTVLLLSEGEVGERVEATSTPSLKKDTTCTAPWALKVEVVLYESVCCQEKGRGSALPGVSTSEEIDKERATATV